VAVERGVALYSGGIAFRDHAIAMNDDDHGLGSTRTLGCASSYLSLHFMQQSAFSPRERRPERPSRARGSA
jgi:hypothetical protein